MAAVAVSLDDDAVVVVPRTVSVVIVTSSAARWADVEVGLDRLERQVRRPDQVVVVVDHADELLRRAADELADRETVLDILVVANVGPVGRPGSRNTGIEWSDGDVIAFLGDDAIPTDVYWVATLMEDYSGADVAGVGGAAIPKWDGSVPAWVPAELGWVFECSFTGLPTDLEAVEDLIGCNLSFRREIFAEIGGFPEDPSTAAPSEFCRRLHHRFAGAKLLFDPDLAVAHRIAPEYAEFSRFASQCWAQGRARGEAGRGFATDREYLTRVLPAGVARGVGDGLRGRMSGFQRAGAIVVGTACSTAGYLRSRVL